MRFIGNKANIVERIDFILQTYGIKGNVFFDFFSGTTSVARFYKKKNYKIYSCDLLYMSYCLQKAYIENNTEPIFQNLLPKLNTKSCLLFASPLDIVVEYLNKYTPPMKGFVYKNYTPGGSATLDKPRKYFSDQNGKKIDGIRTQIEYWKEEKLISENEYFILLACLIETVPFYANISGVYAAFQKNWDNRAIKPLALRTIDIIKNDHENTVYNTDSMDICEQTETDILYIDPPYNERQYAPNYHILETIAKYDNPKIKGVTGMRDYDSQKSKFCNPQSAMLELDKVAKTGKYKYLVLSYNSEGIMPQSQIVETLQQYGDLELQQFEYLRFKSNNNGSSKTKKHIFEQLYILAKK